MHAATAGCRYRQDVQPKTADAPPKEWGSYRQRATPTIGIPIMVGRQCFQLDWVTQHCQQTREASKPVVLRLQHVLYKVAHDISQAWDCVSDGAIVAAADMLERMCQHTPAGVLQRMVDAGCDVAIIGRNQAGCHLCCHRTCISVGLHWVVTQQAAPLVCTLQSHEYLAGMHCPRFKPVQ